jgi:quercetin dioxygenase-like cupin family protein
VLTKSDCNETGKYVYDILRQHNLAIIKLQGMMNVKIQDVPFCTVDWCQIKPTVHPGITGEAYWRTFEMGNIRVRMVEYSPAYFADHWCKRGHVLFVLDGELVTELEDGREFTLTSGMSYQVAEGSSPHRSHTEKGAKLFIVD